MSMNKIMLKLIILPIIILFQTTTVLANSCSISGCNNFTNYGNGNCACVLDYNRENVKDSNTDEYSFIDQAIRFVFLGLPIFFGLAIIKNIIYGGKSGKKD